MEPTTAPATDTPPPAPTTPPTTRTRPTVQRFLMLYRRLENGAIDNEPIPAIVTRVWGPDLCNVVAVSEQFAGNTASFTSVRVYDALTPDQRPSVPESVWGEWSAFQAGQAAKTQEAEGKLAARVNELDEQVSELNRLVGRLLDASKSTPAGVDTEPAADVVPLGQRVCVIEGRLDALADAARCATYAQTPAKETKAVLGLA